jgi:tetratricopeptide (TPR) repeat protein
MGNLAAARWRLGDGAAAERGWRDALAIQPWHRNALQGYATFLVEGGRGEEALPLLERALGVDPDYPAALGTRVQALSVLGRAAEGSASASDAVDRLLADPPRDLGGATEIAHRAAAGSDELAEMLCAKAVRLLGGADAEGGLRVALGIAEGRPSPGRLERLGRAIGAAGRHEESLRYLLGARFLEAEEALARGDREAAAAAALRATELRLSTELGCRVRVQAAGVLVRAGRREAALAEIGWAVSRGWSEAGILESDPAFAPIRQDPAFRGLVEKALRSARRAER